MSGFGNRVLILQFFSYRFNKFFEIIKKINRKKLTRTARRNYGVTNGAVALEDTKKTGQVTILITQIL